MLFALGCGGNQAASTVSSQQPASEQAPESSVIVVSRGFKVNLKYSDKAKQKLIQDKETVIVACYLTGIPKKGALKKYVNRMETISLGKVEAEVVPGESVSFGEVKLPEDRLAQTDGQDPELLINVFSGRKSSESNLLDCGLYEGGLKAIEGRTTDISCKLIAE